MNELIRPQGEEWVGKWVRSAFRGIHEIIRVVEQSSIEHHGEFILFTEEGWYLTPEEVSEWR